MEIVSFEIASQAGNHGDVLAAVGLAALLDPSDNVSICESSTGFVIRPAEAVSAATCRSIPRDAGYMFLRPNHKTPIPTSMPGPRVFDYPKEKERADIFRRVRADARKAGVDWKEATAGLQPHPHFDLYQTLNTLQGDGATNKVALAVAEMNDAEWSTFVWEGLQAIQTGSTARTPWKLDLVQMFTPQAAKGFARLKPDSTGRGDKTKDSWADSFVEALRFRGFFVGVRRFFLGSKGENLRLLVPVPKDIALRNYRAVLEQLRNTPLVGSTASKVDCLAVLELARLLILQHEKTSEPGEHVAGVMIAHYQSMGQSKAVSNLERLALPDWFPVHSVEDADLWIDALREHTSVIRSLNEQYSDELGLIRQYRKYLESRGDSAKEELLRFMEGYGNLVLRERAKASPRKLKQFRTDYFEAIMRETSYAKILENPGFQAVAMALRKATVSAQSLKRNGQSHREIRYDILPELRRKRQLPGKRPFVEAITEFVATYNAESARRFELKKDGGTGRVDETAFAEFLALVDSEKDASVIGALLCAYATCRQPRDAEDPGLSVKEDGPTEQAETESRDEEEGSNDE